MKKYDREGVSKKLKTTIARVTFEKSDGTLRQMLCTLSPQYLNENDNRDENTPKRAVNENVLPVWDLENKQWRSFRLSSIKSISFEAV